jgi:hypothetical protein
VRRVFVLGVLAAVLTSAGCASSRPGHKLAWRTLSRGLISGIQSPRSEVIRDEARYFTVWAEHAASVNRLSLPPRVDFSREMVILVAMGTQRSGGYLIEVVDVELRRGRLQVLVGEREPEPGTLQMQQLTQPYQWVALPLVHARVHFREVYEVGRPGSRRKARPGEDGQRSDVPR